MVVDDYLREAHLTLFYIRVVGLYVACNGGVCGSQLRVAADNLQLVAGEHDVAAARNIDAAVSAQNAAHVYAKAVAKAQVGKAETCPRRVLRNLNLGDMNIAVEQVALV